MFAHKETRNENANRSETKPTDRPSIDGHTNNSTHIKINRPISLKGASTLQDFADPTSSASSNQRQNDSPSRKCVPHSLVDEAISAVSNR